MQVPYQQLPNHARAWIYQSNRSFEIMEVDKIQEHLNTFINSWAAHGQALQACGKVLHHQFVVLLVNEQITKASGCSIDASVAVIKQIEKDFNVSMFNRLLISFRQEEDGQIHTVDRPTFERLFLEGRINEQTIVFNNMVATKGDLEQRWQVPIIESWHKNMLPV